MNPVEAAVPGPFTMKRRHAVDAALRARVVATPASELAGESDVAFAVLYGSFAAAEAFHDVDARVLNGAPVSFLFHVLRRSAREAFAPSIRRPARLRGGDGATAVARHGSKRFGGWPGQCPAAASRVSHGCTRPERGRSRPAPAPAVGAAVRRVQSRALPRRPARARPSTPRPAARPTVPWGCRRAAWRGGIPVGPG